MIILVFLPLFAQSCSDPCIKCSRAEEIWNSCKNTICHENQEYCDNSCSKCYSNSAPTNCSQVPVSQQCSYYNKACGLGLFKSSSGNITYINTIPGATLCNWVLDMRSNLVAPYDKSFFIKISVLSEENTYLKVQTYDLSSSVYDYSIYKANTLNENWSAGVWLSDNIASIYLSTGTDNNFYSIMISWKCDQSAESLTLESIIAIITVSVVLFLCCSCCGFCCFKFSRAWRLRTFRRSQRSRIYQVLPDNSFVHISDEALNSVLPILPYTKQLQEVGEPTCPICFEEFTVDANVRKTECKHIFHSNCIENWIRNNNGVPFCPVCKHLLFPAPEVNQSNISQIENSAL